MLSFRPLYSDFQNRNGVSLCSAVSASAVYSQTSLRRIPIRPRLANPILQLLGLAILLVTCGYLLNRNRFLEITSHAIHPPSRSSHSPPKFFLEGTELELRAKHIYLYMTEYRFIKKGVCASQKTAYSIAMPHDLAFGRKVNPPSSFLLIAHGASPKDHLFLCLPERIPVSLVPEHTETSPEGHPVLVFSFSSPVQAGVLELSNSSTNILSLHSLNRKLPLSPYRENNILRLPFACDTGENPRFALESFEPIESLPEGILLY